MKLSILVAPHPFLRTKVRPVEKVDDSIRQFVRDMFETMYDGQGSGLAATQVGVDKRIVVMDLEAGEDMKPKNPLVFINPEIIKTSEEIVLDQYGCLSVPGVYGAGIERAAEVTVRFWDENEKEKEIVATGDLSICLQHEIDHLNGILFIDHLSRLKRERLLKKSLKYS